MSFCSTGLNCGAVTRQHIVTGQRNTDKGVIARRIGLDGALEGSRGITQRDRRATDGTTLLVLDMPLQSTEIGLGNEKRGGKTTAKEYKDNVPSNSEKVDGHRPPD